MERAVRHKVAMSKAGVWIASIAALLIMAFVAYFETNRTITGTPCRKLNSKFSSGQRITRRFQEFLEMDKSTRADGKKIKYVIYNYFSIIEKHCK